MLEQAAKTLHSNPGTRVKVVGNRNPSEDPKLASERAAAVADKLVNEYGVNADLITEAAGGTGNRTVQIYVLP